MVQHARHLSATARKASEKIEVDGATCTNPIEKEVADEDDDETGSHWGVVETNGVWFESYAGATTGVNLIPSSRDRKEEQMRLGE
jgi:hypothetical protein